MTTKNQQQKNIKLIRDILQDEIRGDVKSAFKKMHKDYSMTWMYQNESGVVFPHIKAKDLCAAMEKIYIIKYRKYDIKNIIAQKNIVMAEMVESYPDPTTSKLHKTPMVIVWEFKNGKVFKGRHYCDPKLSFINW